MHGDRTSTTKRLLDQKRAKFAAGWAEVPWYSELMMRVWFEISDITATSSSSPKKEMFQNQNFWKQVNFVSLNFFFALCAVMQRFSLSLASLYWHFRIDDITYIFLCRYYTSSNGTLKIFAVQEGDEGSYQCVAENDKDMSVSSGSLHLGGTIIIEIELVSSRKDSFFVWAKRAFDLLPGGSPSYM